jgi:hypothetical protein
MKFTCHSCGKEHDLEDLSFGFHSPLQWDSLSDSERSKSVLGEEQCEIDSGEGKSFYVRACLDIPIRGTKREFTWGVWCSLSEKSYTEIAKHWDDSHREKIGPHFGWLCSNIPGYPETVFLKTEVHQRPIGLRPLVKLEPTEHPLAVDQRDGIELARLTDLVAPLLHEGS